jgi:hypothetical protein
MNFTRKERVKTMKFFDLWGNCKMHRIFFLGPLDMQSQFQFLVMNIPSLASATDTTLLVA